MRKILRRRMRRNAELQDGKTIKEFRKFWKEHTESREIVIPKRRNQKPTKKYAW